MFHSDNKDVKSFYDMIINICSDIKDKKVSKSFKAIKDYEESISFFNDNDPRNFIMNILIKTLQIQYSGKINSLSNSKNSIQGNFSNQKIRRVFLMQVLILKIVIFG